MCVFLISPVPIAEPLTSELIDTPVFHNLAPRPTKYRVSVPIPRWVCMICYRAGRYDQQFISRYFSKLYRFHGIFFFMHDRVLTTFSTY